MGTRTRILQDWNDPIQRKAYKAAWRLRNAEHLREQTAQYYLDNKQKWQERNRARYMNNRTEWIARTKAYRLVRHDKVLEWQRKYRKQHPDQNKLYYHKVKARMLEKLGGVCARCGFSDPRALQLDHVNGGGVKEARALGTFRMYRKAVRDPTGYQLLCANCNSIKRWENFEGVGARGN